MDSIRYNPLLMIAYCAAMVLQLGCASWLPSGEEPPAPKGMPGFGTAMVANDAAGVETILVRLNASQSARMPELWAQIDEQAIKPELRIAMDKNGMRAGKISGITPPLLDEWVRLTVQRIGEDPMEQAGFAADVSSFSQLWRCRADVRKELSIRNFQEENLCVFYHDVTAKGHIYEAPHFQYVIQATPHGDASATIRLTPEMQYGELVKKMVARESAVRTDTRRESIAWNTLSIDLRIQKGDYIVIGPTTESRCLGEHFFHTKTQKGEVQPVLLLVRLSEANADSAFARPFAAQPPPTTLLR